MFDRLIRYLPVLDYIKKYKPTKILEVGCSSRGLGEWWEGEFTGCDMDFPDGHVENMRAVVGSVEKLPFPDASFDLVFCLDVFEHLPEKMRGKALSEMMRVSFGVGVDPRVDPNNMGQTQGFVPTTKNKCVIVGFPCGIGAEKLSKKMLDWFESRKSGTAKWMEEHVEMGLPSEINNSFLVGAGLRPARIPRFAWSDRSSDLSLRIIKINNENLKICEWLLEAEEFPRVLKLERFFFLHFRGVVEAFLRRCSFGKCYRKIWIIDKTFKKIPKFKNEKEEREFWQKVDSTDYVDYSKLEHWSFPNLNKFYLKN